MTMGLKANVDGSGAIQVGGSDAINLSTGLNATFVQNADLPNTFGFKNRLINGAMQIDQRNAGASVTATVTSARTYLLDRWGYFSTQASKFTAQQNAASVTPPAGFTNYLGITSSSAYSPISSDIILLQQPIEGFNVADLAWGTASAATVTLSFWVRSSLTGTFAGSLGNSANDRLYPFTFTINSANTWEKETITIVGDTSGTWVTNNGVGLYLNFNLGTGSTYLGTAGSWSGSAYYSATGGTNVVGTNGATFYITGVQLEKGTTATSFDYRPYGTELSLCQRYYYRISGSAGRQGVGYAKTTTTSDIAISFPVTMRTNPSALEQSGTASDYLVTYQSSATACSSVPTFTNASSILGIVNYTVSAVLTAGNGVAAGANSANSYLGWSAEL